MIALLILLLAQDPKAAFDRGDYATAVRLFEAANQRLPDCANLLYIGLARYRLRQTNEALISFRAAAQCDPKLVAAHLALAEAYSSTRNDREALAAYLQVLALEPHHLAALRAASNLYLKNDLHGKSRGLLETLSELSPTAETHADLGAVHAASGDRAAAEIQFRRALALEPNYFPALSGLGNLLARAGEHATAIPLLRQAVATKPTAYEGHFLLGSALNRLDQFAEARTQLEQAVRLGGANEPQVFYQLARAWGGLGRPAERQLALAKFSALTKQEKDDAERQRESARLVDEARTLLGTGDLDLAAQRLEQAREARPGDATLLFRLAGLNFDLHRLGVAREYAQAAISISPTTWLYHYLLGLVEKSANRLPDARASLELAARLSTPEKPAPEAPVSNAPVFNALGEVLLAQGNRQAAIANFRKACDLAPAEPAFRRNLDAALK